MKRGLLVLFCALTACNVKPLPTSGGAILPQRGDCPRGLALVSSDYQSSEIALLDPDGNVASSAFLSSASSAASGLAAAFSGDLVVEPAPSRPGELAVVDRFGTNVVTFVDTRTAAVRAQLPVGTGFEANAQGYLELDEHHAYVPRLGENSEPGREPFDAGSDLLLVDPSVPHVTGSLPMPRRAGYLPRPVGATRVGEVVVVTLQHGTPDFSGMAEGELVGVSVGDAPRVLYRLPLPGLKNCGKARLSPSRARLALSCEGYIDRRGNVLEPETSAVVLLDASASPPVELRRFGARELFGSPVQPVLEFVSEGLVLLKTQTAQGSEQDNQLMTLNLDSAETSLLATAARDPYGLGFGLAFGGLSCAAGCGDPCFVCDISRGSLRRFRLHDDALAPEDDVHLAGAGLPPTAVTPFW